MRTTSIACLVLALGALESAFVAPPATPSAPSGPTSGLYLNASGTTGFQTYTATYSGGNSVQFVWNDGSPVTKISSMTYVNGAYVFTVTHAFAKPGAFSVYVRDYVQGVSGPAILVMVDAAQPPQKPAGPFSNLTKNVVYSYTVVRYPAFTDEDGTYYPSHADPGDLCDVDWGDGTRTLQVPFPASGTLTLTHSWSRGGLPNFPVKARVSQVYPGCPGGRYSVWTAPLVVSVKP